MIYINAKAMLTNDANYYCHIKAEELINQSYELHITPPVINVTVWAKTQHVRTQTEIHFISPAYSYTK